MKRRIADPELASLPRPTRGYLLSAALVSRFKPENLTPLDDSSLKVIRASDAERNDALSFVIGNSRPVGFDDPAQFSWALDDDVRRRVLESMESLDRVQEALRSLPSEIGDDEPLKAFFGSDTSSGTPPLDVLSNRRQALVWLQPFFANDEHLRKLDREIERAGLLAPLQRLASAHFVGRSDELDFLRRFVGVLPVPPRDPAPTLSSKIGRLGAAIGGVIGELSDWAGTILRDQDVLLVTAPGGMGKSALLARFLLDHWQADLQWRTPFAFLDFDRPSLLSRDLCVPLEEIGRQLSIEIGSEIPTPWAQRAVSEAPAGATGGGTIAATGANEASDVDRAYLREREVNEYAHGVARALRASQFSGKPLLLVLDTLERVFRRGRHWIAALDDMIKMLRSASIEVRVVAAGRAFLAEQRAKHSLGSREIRWRERTLAKLGSAAAEQLLLQSGLPQEHVQTIAKQVGGVPLSLHLAADCFKKRRGDFANLSELTRSWLFKRRLEDEIIQGNLYQRILKCVEEPEVAPLAYPGLILREVTPALIMEVLAEPCGLGVVSKEKGAELFKGLAKEFTLVDEVGKDRLKHRADVRQLMLKQMLASDPLRARRISEAAIRYYKKYPDPKNRAEELYHRLLLGQDKEEIQSRWLPGVEDYMGEEVIDDIPSIGLRVYAATRLNLEIRDEQWLQQADDETWERKVAQDFDARLKLGQVREALQLVSGRAEFVPGSPLYPLVAQAHADVRDYATAARWIDDGLQRIERVSDPAGRQTLIELYLVRARMFEFIADGAGVDVAFVAGEIEQLNALWREYGTDTRVLLVALLEVEALQRKGAQEAVALQRWLVEHAPKVQADRGAIDSALAIKMLATLGRDFIDVARWLIENPAVRDALLRIIKQLATRQIWPLAASAATLIGILQTKGAGATSNAGVGGPKPGQSALSPEEVAGLAEAISFSADETRDQLLSVKR